MFCNNWILPYIVDFGVCPPGDFPVHSVLQLRPTRHDAIPHCTKLKPPAGLHDAFEVAVNNKKAEDTNCTSEDVAENKA